MNGKCTRDTVCPPRPRHPGGFTLLELLVVMAIMIGITTIVLMNTIGGTRSSAYASAANDVLNSCMLAHQRACIDGTKSYLFMTDSSNFCLVHWVGTVSQCFMSGNNLMMDDVYSDLSAYTNGGFITSSSLILVDMDKGTSAGVIDINTRSNLTTNNPVAGSWTYPSVYELTLAPTNNTTVLSTANWSPGDNYGIALQSGQMLPRGFHFELGNTIGGGSSSYPAGNYIVFNPDGTLSCNWASSGASAYLSIAEDIRSGLPGATASISQQNCIVLKFDPTGQISRSK